MARTSKPKFWPIRVSLKRLFLLEGQHFRRHFWRTVAIFVFRCSRGLNFWPTVRIFSAFSDERSRFCAPCARTGAAGIFWWTVRISTEFIANGSPFAHAEFDVYMLACASWDNSVRLFSVQRNQQSNQVQVQPGPQHQQKAPVLCCAWGHPNTPLQDMIFTGSCDNTYTMWNYKQNKSNVLIYIEQ